MNIKITDSWLREFLDTKAKPSEIAKYLSLSGPAVERLTEVNGEYIYDIEVTTNRGDLMSVYGIAREATAILPQFGIKAVLKPMPLARFKSKPRDSLKLDIRIDPKLTKRVVGIIITDIQNSPSPRWMIRRLEASGFRSLGSIVDITNYVMTEVGQPTHAFDYDLIKTHKMLIREARKGERFVSLEGREYSLLGGDIVIDDGTGQIIDLPGIIGSKSSVVRKETKNVIFFTENNDPVRIRQTSMSLGIRTVAAILNEKGVDPELSRIAILRGLGLFQKICAAKIGSLIYDLYPIKPVYKKVFLSQELITKKLGVEITKEIISTILKSLDFQAKWERTKLAVIPPSFRLNDISIPEDIIEEIARIYGYHNFPSRLMEGALPKPNLDTNFEFETKVKNILKDLGGVEVYTSSLVSKEMAGEKAYGLKNPLGAETKYLRTTLLPSLKMAVQANSGVDSGFHLFEMANIYLKKLKMKSGRLKFKAQDNNTLPEERMMVAGMFANYDYRKAKGGVETFLEELKIKAEFEQRDLRSFVPSRALQINCLGQKIGVFGILENEDNIYYEFEVAKLVTFAKPFEKFKPIPKYPAQIEDLTFTFPDRVKIGEVIKAILESNKLISDARLITIYKDAYTVRIWYQDPKRTLNNQQIEKARRTLISRLKNKFGAKIVT